VTVHVAFLRAVNVGKRTVKMARLVELVEALGHADVWTYINSGNVVFEATGTRADLEQALEQAFEKAFGFEVTTFVRTASELRRIVAAEPMRIASSDTYFVTFLKDAPTKAVAAQLESLGNEFDSLVVRGRDVHWRMHGRSTETTLKSKSWEELIGRHRSTSRNMNMLRKLVAKLDDGR
jgi:uncharacterized protein (DUF1697 family)